MEWTSKLCLELIKAYRKYPVLWDPDRNFYSSASRFNAWEELAKQFNTDSDTIKRKISSLLASYRRERRKRKRRETSTWFAFEALHEFLSDRYKPLDDKSVLLIPDNSNHMFTLEQQTELEEENSESENSKDGQNSTELNNSNIKTDIEYEYLDNDPIATNSNLLENTNSPTSRKAKKFSSNNSSSKKRKFTINNLEDLNFLNTKHKDECTTFGEYLASKLRRYDSYTRALVQKNINNVLFEADTGKLPIDETDFANIIDSPSPDSALVVKR